MSAISIFLINLRSSTPLVLKSGLKMCFKFPSASTFSEPSGEGVLFSIVADKEKVMMKTRVTKQLYIFMRPTCLSAVSGIPQPFANWYVPDGSDICTWRGRLLRQLGLRTKFILGGMTIVTFLKFSICTQDVAILSRWRFLSLLLSQDIKILSAFVYEPCV